MIHFSQFIGLVIIALFGEITLCSENSIQNILGALGTLVVCLIFESAYYQFNKLVAERPFVMREINNGLYCIEAYCMAKLFDKVCIIYSLTLQKYYKNSVTLAESQYLIIACSFSVSFIYFGFYNPIVHQVD